MLEQSDADLSPAVVLGACFTLSTVYGAFYVWSMLLPSLETLLQCSTRVCGRHVKPSARKSSSKEDRR